MQYKSNVSHPVLSLDPVCQPFLCSLCIWTRGKSDPPSLSLFLIKAYVAASLSHFSHHAIEKQHWWIVFLGRNQNAYFSSRPWCWCKQMNLTGHSQCRLQQSNDRQDFVKACLLESFQHRGLRLTAFHVRSFTVTEAVVGVPLYNSFIRKRVESDNLLALMLNSVTPADFECESLLNGGGLWCNSGPVFILRDCGCPCIPVCGPIRANREAQWDIVILNLRAQEVHSNHFTVSLCMVLTWWMLDWEGMTGIYY